MTWDELCEKAKELGYAVDVYMKYGVELYNDDKRMCFFRNGEVCFLSTDEVKYYTIAKNKTCDEMYQIMKLLR